MKSTKEKVLFVLGGGVYPFKTGGMEIFNYYLIKELRNTFDLRYISSKKLNFDGVTHHKSLHLRPEKYLWPLQLFVHFLTHWNERTILISFSAAHWIVWYLEYLIIKLFRLKSIAVIHYGKSVPKEKPNVYKKFFAIQKHVVAVSADIKKNYDSAFETNCEVIYPLVPFEKASESKAYYRTKYGIQQDANVICMVGSIKKMKNPDTLIEAIALMSEEERERYKPMACFAGGGDMVESLKQLAKDKGVLEYTKFLGIIPKEKVNEIFALADIYLIASDFEGTSVSLLEAMYNKLPIIISRAPGLIDMIEEGKEGLTFETRNAEELYHKITEIIDLPAETKIRINNASAKYNAKYNYESVVKEYINILT